MDTGTEQTGNRPKGRKPPPPRTAFKPGVSGNPKGRPRLTPEERERRRQAQRAHDRLVLDVSAELRAMVGPALDKLRALIDDADPAVALRAATDCISRVNGLPVATNIVALGTGQEVRKLSADDVREAARVFQLRQGAAQAADVLGTVEHVHAVDDCSP
jgi:hypothetical protein